MGKAKIYQTRHGLDRAHLWQRVLCSGFVYQQLLCDSTICARLDRRRFRCCQSLFGVGQILGTIAIGAITEKLGSLSYALNVPVVTLVLGAIACICQRPTATSIQSASYGRQPRRVPVPVTSALPPKAAIHRSERNGTDC